MHCDRCKKNEASVHLTEIIKSVKSEVHLCEFCARDIGLNSKLNSFSLSIPDMLSFLDSDSLFEVNELKICPSCGYSLLEINKKNRMGCPDCYETFSDMVDQIIKGVDPRLGSHRGSVPENRTLPMKKIPVSQHLPEDEESLRKKMMKAVEDEKYEEAALLRDKIRSLSKSPEGNLI